MGIDCVDPVFIGTAVYTTVGFKVRKLSRLARAWETADGRVEFDTLNNRYLPVFTDRETRDAFCKTCETVGRWG